MRTAIAAVLAAVLVAQVAPGASAAGASSVSGFSSVAHGVLAGAVADVPSGMQVQPRMAVRARAAGGSSSNLPYGGGPVLHSNRTHVIFWQPSGSGLTFDPGYISVVETFLKRVAADSRRPTNVYGLTGQYHDQFGPAAYASRYGRSVIDTDPLPSNGCTEPPTVPLGWQLHCVNGGQIESEVEKVIHADHLPTAGRDVYFLLTPNGLGSCLDSDPADGCALGGPEAPNSYCGYHNVTNDGTIMYAVIPYNAVSGHCQSSNPRPNGSTADPALSSLSHEHSEMITDPQGTAWIDSSGNEDGDLCLTNFGPNRGGSGQGAWNQTIHGGHYYIQEEWSNDDGACAQRDEAGHVAFGGPSLVPEGVQVAFSGWAKDPDGKIRAYHWAFGDGVIANHSRTVHRFTVAGLYRVQLRTTDDDGNYAFAHRFVRVVR